VDDRLDAALHALATEVTFPPTPDVRAGVVDRMRDSPRGGWRTGVWHAPRAIVLALVITLLLAATAAALVLVLPGLRITAVPLLPSAEPLAARLALGERLAPDSVRAGIPVVLGPPDEAYVIGDHQVLSLVYAAGPELPEMAGSGIGLLVQVIDGALDREQVEKLVAEAGTAVTRVEVGGEAGFWIEGLPHVIRYADAEGDERAQRTRLVGDTLVWEHGGVLYRMESGLGLDETLRIAESVAR
jgi:hypothetical protein